MQIRLTSVMVDDQDKALKFYTEVLGFVKKADIPVGEFKWLTVVSPEAPGAVELALEPMGYPAAKAFQEATYQAGLPYAVFFVADLHQEYERMTKLGVTFRMKPTDMGWGMQAVFDDTCGNFIQLNQL